MQTMCPASPQNSCTKILDKPEHEQIQIEKTVSTSKLATITHDFSFSLKFEKINELLEKKCKFCGGMSWKIQEKRTEGIFIIYIQRKNKKQDPQLALRRVEGKKESAANKLLRQANIAAMKRLLPVKTYSI